MRLLSPKPGDTYLDLTAGYGGHATEVIRRIGTAQQATLVDRDDFAIENLNFLKEAGAEVVHMDFLTAAENFIKEGRQFDVVLLDLGVSSPQLDNPERGFSIKQDGPLDMRMDRSQSLTAEKVINTYTEKRLAKIIREYGDEPRSYTIAHAIRQARPLRTTAELAQVIAKVYHGKWKKIHPATRTFQAIRIEVNNEIDEVRRTLLLLPKLLHRGGRVAVISFHSLEDRLVKHYFKEQIEAGFEAELKVLTKKPISGAIYDVHNPRARSAKLRAAVKK